MPLYEFACDKNHRQEHFISTDRRDALDIRCDYCKKKMKRLPGGHGMLYFEEGRPRVHLALSDKPITSKAQHERLKRVNGVVESGNTVPPSVARNPKSEGMKRFMGKDHGGRWI